MSAEHQDAKLNAAERHALPGKMFAAPAHEGLPLEDEGHVRAAMGRFDQEQFTGPAERKAAFHKIIARAHQLGIDPSGFEKKHGGRLDDKDNVMDELQKQLTAAQAALTAASTRADQAEKDRDAALKAKETAEISLREAQKDLKAEKVRADSAEEAKKAVEEKVRTDAAAHLDARVQERVELFTAANAVLGATDKDKKPVDRSKMSDREIKVAIARHVDGADAVEDKDTDDAVNASYRGAMKRHAKATGSRTDAAVAVAQMREIGTTAIANKSTNAEAAALAGMTSTFARKTR